MNLTCLTKPNRLAVAFVAGLLSNRTTLPVLSFLRMGGNDDDATLTSTDLECTLTALLQTEGARTNEPCLLPGKRIADMFKTGEKISIASNCHVADVTMDGGAFTLNQLPVADWPEQAKHSASPYPFTLGAEALTEGLRLVEDAISSDESRYVLNGIFFRVTPGQVTLVATDGRRLHLAVVQREIPDDLWLARIDKTTAARAKAIALRDGPTNVGDEVAAITKALKTADAAYEKAIAPVEFILPSGTLPHLHRLLKAQPKDIPVLIEPNDERVRISGDRLLLSTKLIEGIYPNYKCVIPSQEDVKARLAVDVPKWLAALRTVEKFTSEKSNSIKFLLTKNLLTLTASAPDLGTGKASIELNYDGPDRGIGFDPRYIIEALTPHKDGKHNVTFAMNDELSPCIISTGTKYNTDRTITVVMPMRLS